MSEDSVSDTAGQPRPPITVAIVDDHSIFRSGLRADLDTRLEVVEEASDVDSAVAAILHAKPEVVLLDVHLPGGGGGGGAEVARRTAADCPGTRFLALSVSDAAEDVVGVIRAGARGYLTKGSSGGQVSDAVVAVAGGDAVFSPKLAGFVLDAFGATSGEQAESTDELDRLSAREREVMRLIARGFAYKEVAAELFISIKTVETHVSAVLRKLQLSSRHELTAWALERKLL
jgi:DNA-binding NarL/FixJ family response regulator